MNRAHGSLGALLLVVVIGFGGYPSMQSAQPSNPMPRVPTASDTTQIGDDDAICLANNPDVGDEAPAVEQAGATGLEAAVCSRCPDGTPQCWSDKSCDTFCGGKGFGSCVRINSCYKCCACAL